MIRQKLLQQSTFPPPCYAPGDLWPLALAELRQQMTKATFNTWLADSHLLTTASTSSFWVIVVCNEYAWEWLTFHLCPVVVRTVVGLVGDEVTICFIPRAMRRGWGEPLRRPPSPIPGGGR